MRKMLPIAALFLVLLAGCGGGGSGGGEDIDPGTSMIGRWQPISAVQDGTTVVPLSTAMMSYGSTWTRGEYEFRQDGTCSLYGYMGNTLVQTVNGTWNSDNQVAPITLEGVTVDVSWSDGPANVMSANFDRNGHSYQTRWVRVVTVTGHDLQLVGTWQAAAVEVNGVATPVADFFEFEPGSDAMTIEFQADGDAISREMSGATVVSTENQTWATSEGEFTLTMDSTLGRGYYTPGTVQLVVTFVNPADGSTVEITWNRLVT